MNKNIIDNPVSRQPLGLVPLELAPSPFLLLTSLLLLLLLSTLPENPLFL